MIEGDGASERYGCKWFAASRNNFRSRVSTWLARDTARYRPGTDVSLRPPRLALERDSSIEFYSARPNQFVHEQTAQVELSCAVHHDLGRGTCAVIVLTQARAVGNRPVHLFRAPSKLHLSSRLVVVSGSQAREQDIVTRARVRVGAPVRTILRPPADDPAGQREVVTFEAYSLRHR